MFLFSEKNSIYGLIGQLKNGFFLKTYSTTIFYKNLRT